MRKRLVSCEGFGVGIATVLLASACVAAASQGATDLVPFTEEAVERGVDYLVTFGGYPSGVGCGVGLLDLDGDGDPDLVTLGKAGGAVGLFENDGTGHFTDRFSTSTLGPITHPSGLTAADYDGDGDIDLFVSMWQQSNRLLRNEGNFQFTDMTEFAGVGGVSRGMGCTWADYNNDGWVDLYVSNWSLLDANQFYRNMGNGQFYEIGAPLGIDDSQLTFQAVMFDYDGDTDIDLYLSTDRGEVGCNYNNRLFSNQGGLFFDISDQSDAGICLDSMGVAVGDLDRDLLLDIYCTNTPAGNRLLMNEGGGNFIELGGEAGVQNNYIGWGTAAFDYDNDGLEELYICNMGAPNRLYDCSDGWPCVDTAPVLGLDTMGLSFATATGDVDMDGDLDLVTQNDDELIRLFINQQGQDRRWVKFEVVGQGTNTTAVGATVRIRSGNTRQIRHLMAGLNFKSQNHRVLHFGMGSATVLDEVLVLWPGGSGRFLRNYPTNRTWTVYPPERMGDANGDGAIDAFDLKHAALCLSGPEDAAGPADGCEMMDWDSDGDVDLRDYALIHTRAVSF